MKLFTFLAAALILILFFLHPIDSDGDFWQHLNIGKFVWENRSLPRVDNLTFTAAGRSFIGYSWGAGVIYYLLYSNFGALAINLLGLIIGILTIALLYLLLKSLKINTGCIIITLLLALPLIASRWPTRPEIFIYPIFLSALLIDYWRQKRPFLALLYPVLTLILVNLYGSSAPGFLLLLGLIFVRLSFRAKRSMARNLLHKGISHSASAPFEMTKQGFVTSFRSHLNTVISSVARNPIRAKRSGFEISSRLHPSFLFHFSILLCFPLAFLNGYGAKSVFFMARVPQMTRIWGDWEGIISILTAPNFYHFPVLSLWTYFSYLLLFISLIALLTKNLPRQPLYAILSLTLLVPFLALRLKVLAVILSAPYFAILLAKVSLRSHLDTVISNRVRRGRNPPHEQNGGFEQGSKHSWIEIISALIGLVSSVWFVLDYPPAVGGNDYYFPPRLISFIKKHSLSGRAFNTQRVGSFLEYHLSPQIKTLSDTRDDLFIGTGVLEDLEAFVGSKTSSLYLLRKYKIDIVIVNLADGPGFRDLLHDSDWSLVYFDGNYLVFLPSQIARIKNLPTLQISDPFI